MSILYDPNNDPLTQVLINLDIDENLGEDMITDKGDDVVRNALLPSSNC